MTPDRPTVLIVGAASRDIASDDPRGWRLGGAVMYGGLALARLGIGVRALVGVDAAARMARELEDLSTAGATVAVAELPSGPVFENLEAPTGRRQRCLAAAAPIPLTAIPRAWTVGHDALVLAPVAGELGSRWATLAPAVPGGPVALGWQGLLRELVPGADVRRLAPRPDPLLAAATLVVASREDFAPGTEPTALAGLLSPGATLVYTEGEEGGRVIADAAVSRYDAMPSDVMVDPTGAGDVFLAAMLAGLLRPSLGVPTMLGAAAASLTVELPGLEGVPTLDAVRRRLTRAPSLASRRPSATSSLGRGRPSQA